MAELSPAARTIVGQARTQLAAALDEVDGWLLRPDGDVAVESKRDGTVVTALDHDVEERLADRLTVAFPGHGILSEERRTTSPDTDWAWVIDPIDGTSNFTCRLPYWCVSVALAHEGTPVLGVVDAPVLARRYTAVRGEGAWLVDRTVSCGRDEQRRRPQRLQVRAPVDWRDRAFRHLPVMLTTATARHARSAGLALNPRVMGSTALDLAVVAEGVAVAAIAMTPKVWDIAAGVLLVEEAGGTTVTLGSDPLVPFPRDQQQAGRSAVTAAGPDADYVRELAEALLPG